VDLRLGRPWLKGNSCATVLTVGRFGSATMEQRDRSSPETATPRPGVVTKAPSQGGFHGRGDHGSDNSY
jgi:hypothetical protein